MSIEMQKHVLVEVLNKLEELGFEVKEDDLTGRPPQLVAAGGCVVNWDLGHEANDIDLWLRHDAVLMKDTFEDAELIMDKLGVVLKNKTAINVSGHSYEGIGRISAVYGFSYQGVDFDIIFHGLECPKTGFDSAINRASCYLNNSRNDLTFERDMCYKRALRNKEFFCNKHETDTVDRYIRRLIKQYKKFKPWGFKVIDHYGNVINTDDFDTVKSKFEQGIFAI